MGGPMGSLMGSPMGSENAPDQHRIHQHPMQRDQHRVVERLTPAEEAPHGVV
jgi:hypothetical protein